MINPDEINPVFNKNRTLDTIVAHNDDGNDEFK